MGLFNKKLDYSSGNGNLPKLNSDNYLPLSLPNSSTFYMPDMNLMVKERDHGTLEKALLASIEASANAAHEAQFLMIIDKYIGKLKECLAPNLNQEETELLAKLMRIGCGMAIVESQSGLMVDGKAHPSIMNVYSRFRLNMGEDMQSQFQSPPVDMQLVEVALEVGYVGSRLNGQPSPEDMFASVRAFN